VTSPLPSLFGRFTAILKDHDHLKTTLGRLREMCAALEVEIAELPPALAPERLLHELYDDMKEHFTAEESQAYFGAIMDEAPALRPRVAELISDHSVVLAAVQDLLNLARQPDGRTRLAFRTRELVAHLERHERAESVLLREFFSPPN
jgi:hemerythrin